MREAFPNGGTDITNIPEGVDLSTLTSDPDDQHVCALALAGNAQLLITFDDSFNREALLEHGVAVLKPDALLAPSFDEQPGLFLTILERQAQAWGDRTMLQLLDALERAAMPVFVSEARTMLDV